MKQTKPAQAMELRSLSPVFGGPAGGARNGRGRVGVATTAGHSPLRASRCRSRLHGADAICERLSASNDRSFPYATAHSLERPSVPKGDVRRSQLAVVGRGSPLMAPRSSARRVAWSLSGAGARG